MPTLDSHLIYKKPLFIISKIKNGNLNFSYCRFFYFILYLQIKFYSLCQWQTCTVINRIGMSSHINFSELLFTHYFLFSLSCRHKIPLTSRYYSGFGNKLSPFFGFAKSFQTQNHLSIKPIAQIRCSSC